MNGYKIIPAAKNGSRVEFTNRKKSLRVKKKKQFYRNGLFPIPPSNMASTKHNESALVEIVYEFARVQSFVGLFVLVFGVIGNVLACFTVYHFRSMRETTKILFISLSISDTITLFNPGVRAWLHVAYDIYSFTGYNPAQCRLMYFSAKLSQCMSLWCIVLMSFERFMGVCFPAKNLFNNAKRTFVILILQALMLCIVYSYTFTMLQKGDRCYPHFDIPIAAATIIDACFRVFIPISLTIILCALILIKMKKKMRKVEESTNRSNRVASNPIKMLFAASLFEASVILPSGIILIFFGFGSMPLDLATFILFYRCVEIVVISNNAANFYIYLLVSRTFRHTLWTKIRICLSLRLSEPGPSRTSGISASRG